MKEIKTEDLKSLNEALEKFNEVDMYRNLAEASIYEAYTTEEEAMKSPVWAALSSYKEVLDALCPIQD